MKKIKAKIKVIYNPKAGEKRRLIPHLSTTTLEDIKELFERYKLPADFYASHSTENAIELAKNSAKEGYEIVVAAGGDGTVATIAHGLINTNIALAVLPLGSVMNIARMLAIPFELEMAVALIKINKTRKIDLGQILKLNGEKVEEPSYFVEQAGVGFDADYRYWWTLFIEKYDFMALIKLFKLALPLFGPRVEVIINGKSIEKKARMVIISNGPLSGYGLQYAPKAKLNDHVLTVTILTLSKLGLAKFLLNIILRKKGVTSHIKVVEADKVLIKTRDRKMIHADSRVFGTTPAEFKIVPSCLNVITGFPKEGASALKKRTLLDI